ncbi:hypothetical protein KGF54_000213 [Candida jiufengensis]|uniref:uncharacterized protein n=1 Tax=Candida jiufengensis TaxID=497108 RepID=UPI00222574BE|nr:uncharacterized protein KGF54_000213 [Candida jiufengensis]KAI5957285.1 hypothetical protein KGF54_000213 [Candida jiufengensis]
MDTTSIWSPSTIPTSTTLSSIATTYAPQLTQTLSSLIGKAKTETNHGNLLNIQEAYRAVQASLTIISAEQILATATASSVKSAATDAILKATLNLKAVDLDNNIFGYELNKPGNIIFLIINIIIMAYITIMIVWSRYWGFNITFFCGYALEFIGFVGRILAIHDNASLQNFLMNTVCLTSASDHTSQSTGNAITLTGICVQVFAMTIFLIFWFEFLNRLFFKRMFQESTSEIEKNPLRKRSFVNFFKLLFNVKSVRTYRRHYLEQFYNPKFASVRDHKLFPFMPLAMTLAVIVVYIRCVYRVVEMVQGYSGYLMTHEVYLLTLDATMISICGLIFIPFHPVWVFGKNNLVKLASIKKNKDKENNCDDESSENTIDGLMENLGEKSTRVTL